LPLKKLNPEKKEPPSTKPLLTKLLPTKNVFPVILFSGSDFPIALIVDSILYNRDLMVQALGSQFKLTNELVGATVLGDGQVVFILDPYTLSMDTKALLEREKIAKETEENK